MNLRVVLVALLACLMQVTLHAGGSSWVIPNFALIFVVWYTPKLDYVAMTMLVVMMSVVLEIGSVLPTGLMLLGLFLVMLASKLVFRDGRDAHKWSFQISLVAVATVIFSGMLYALLPVEALNGELGRISLRIVLELLYNIGILLLIIGLSDRRQQAHSHYRLPQ